jgi:hypothetical protein
VIRNIFESSAKNGNSEKIILAHKSLIQVLKNRVPKWSLVAFLRAWGKASKTSLSANNGKSR